MQRRDFIFATGVVVSASYVAPHLLTKKGVIRPQPNLYNEPILKAITYGITAPNPHNTQAWKFKLISDTEMLFYVDETRILPETDPSTRQIHIGCGAFLSCLVLGMQKEGYESNITLFPEGNYTKMDIGKKAIAQIKLESENDITVSELSNYLFERSTSRLGYKNEALTSNEFSEIKALTNPRFSEIKLIQKEDNLTEILSVLYEGMEVETYTYQTHEESRKWFRPNDDLIEEKRDGINLRGGGTTGITRWFAEKELKGLKEESWHNEKNNEIFLKKYKKKVLETPSILILKTSENAFVDWINAGRDYARLQLACHHKGYYLHPLSQVLQEFEEMKSLREKFEGLMQVKSPEKIQMALRVGKSKKPFLSYRRFTNDFLV